MKKRRFHIGDILSVTTGKNVSPRRMEGVVDVIKHMANNRNIPTTSLESTSEKVRDAILAQHPHLEDIQFPDISDLSLGQINPFIEIWLLEQCKVLGADSLELESLPEVMTLSPDDMIDEITHLHPAKEFHVAQTSCFTASKKGGKKTSKDRPTKAAQATTAPFSLRNAAIKRYDA